MPKADYISGQEASRRSKAGGFYTSSKTIAKLGREGGLPRRKSDKRYNWVQIEGILRDRYADRQREGVGSAAVVRTGTAPPPDLTSVGARMATARLAKATMQARLLEVRVKQERGELVVADEVRREGLHVGHLIRAKLLAMPAVAAKRCAGKTAPEIETILTDGVNDALEALRESDWTIPLD